MLERGASAAERASVGTVDRETLDREVPARVVLGFLSVVVRELMRPRVFHRALIVNARACSARSGTDQINAGDGSKGSKKSPSHETHGRYHHPIATGRQASAMYRLRARGHWRLLASDTGRGRASAAGRPRTARRKNPRATSRAAETGPSCGLSAERGVRRACRRCRRPPAHRVPM